MHVAGKRKRSAPGTMVVGREVTPSEERTGGRRGYNSRLPFEHQGNGFAPDKSAHRGGGGKKGRRIKSESS